MVHDTKRSPDSMLRHRNPAFIEVLPGSSIINDDKGDDMSVNHDDIPITIIAANELTGDDKSSCCDIVHYLVKTVMLAITTRCITSYLGINIQVSYLDLIQ